MLARTKPAAFECAAESAKSCIGCEFVGLGRWSANDPASTYPCGVSRMRSPITHMETPVQHGIIKALQEWFQPLLAWIASATATAAVFLPSVNQFFAAILTLTTILWTVERWKQTRTERRLRELQLEAYEENVHSPDGRSRLKAFLTRLTAPGGFDDQSHHEGK